MLKGQVFKEQIFENQIFAVFINTFLNGKNGIINGYKNSMAVSAGSNSITVQSGVVCIQGRFLEEDTYTTLNTTTETAYCSLVVEIDLDKINTETEFNQGHYKILKNANNYPSLINDDIVNTNSGIYQYELARFRTSLNGISDVVDMRSYIDYESLYEEIEKKLQEVEDESYFLPRSEFDAVKEKIKNPFPVGSIYMSMISNNPSEYFGGTWVQISRGRVLVGVDENDNELATSNLQGGEKEHILTIDEMPSHTHVQNAHRHTVPMGYTNPEWTNGMSDTNRVAGGPNERVGETTFNTSNATATNQNTGGGQPMSLMQPYLSCYIWQRTA